MRTLVRRFLGASGERRLETLSLLAGAVAFVAVALVALPVFGLQDAAISGPGSVGQYAAIASAVAATLAFVAGRAAVRERGRRLGALDLVDEAALALAHTVISLLSWTLVADILGRGFVDAQIYPVSVLLLSGAVAGVTAYLVFASAAHMDLQLLATILAVFLVEGVVASMLTASDPHWWRDNLSALGMTDDLSALAFNLTVIVAGVLVTTLARAATTGIPDAAAHGVRNVRLCLVLVGIFLALVGVFPVDDFFLLHTGFASGMVVVFGVLIVRLPAWIPGLPPAFLGVGYLFLAVIAVLVVLFAVGYYTLTAVELVAGVLVFTWIILFIRSASAVQVDSAGSPAPAS